MAAATEEVEAGVESVGLEDDAGAQVGVQATNLDQASLFRAVQDGRASSITALLKNRSSTTDVNAYNSEGATALHLAVYKYEEGRNIDVTTTLLEYGADLSIKAAPPPSAHRVSLVRHDQIGGAQETKKISFDHKTPLLLALEFKSSLYLKGWEYRHWDALIIILAKATIKQYAAKDFKVPSFHPHAMSEIIQQNWEAVFRSGKHEVVELVAEGKEIEALKLLVTSASKILRLNLIDSKRIEIHDTSYNLAKAMVHFLYVGKVDPVLGHHRGIDLFITAHKYGVDSLKRYLEASIVPTQDNWIKVLHAACDSNSDVLTLKTAESIKSLLEGRQTMHGLLTKSFSDVEGAPQQLYQGASNS